MLAAFYRTAEAKMKKKRLRLSALLFVVLALDGCATLNGMGEDIQSVGRAVKRAVSGG
jgi:predicted small secreted protein